jgi:hypothetical protein
VDFNPSPLDITSIQYQYAKFYCRANVEQLLQPIYNNCNKYIVDKLQGTCHYYILQTVYNNLCNMSAICEQQFPFISCDKYNADKLLGTCRYYIMETIAGQNVLTRGYLLLLLCWQLWEYLWQVTDNLQLFGYLRTESRKNK